MDWPNPALKLDKLCSSQKAFSVGWDPLQESGLVGSEKVPVIRIMQLLYISPVLIVVTCPGRDIWSLCMW